MKTKVNKYIILLLLPLVSIFALGFGCSSSKPKSDPLAGWQKAYGEDPNPIIEKDYQSYIHGLSPKEQKFVGPSFYYKDRAGQHALRIEVDIDGTDCWYHILFYDKENRRINVVKYFYGHYRS